MIKRIKEIAGAPIPVGPYSTVSIVHGLAYVSGQIGIDPSKSALVPGGVEAEAKQILSNLHVILEFLGASFKQVVKCTIFMTDLADFKLVNQLYGAAVSESEPSRSTVQVAGLPLGAKVEIEIVAVVE